MELKLILSILTIVATCRSVSEACQTAKSTGPTVETSNNNYNNNNDASQPITKSLIEPENSGGFESNSLSNPNWLGEEPKTNDKKEPDFEVLTNTIANETVRQDALNFATLAYLYHGQKPNNAEQSIADYLRQQFNQKYGLGWVAVVSSRGSNFSTAANYGGSDFVALRRRSTTPALLQIFRPICSERKPQGDQLSMDELNTGGAELLAQKSDSTMDLAAKQASFDAVLLALSSENNRMGVARFIKNHMEQRFGANWLVVVGDDDFSGSYAIQDRNLIFIKKSPYHIAIILPDCQQSTTTTTTTTTASITTTTQAQIAAVQPSASTTGGQTRNIPLSIHSASKASDDVRNLALSSAQTSIQLLNKSQDRCNYIKTQMEQRYGGRWFCGSGKSWSARYQFVGTNMVVLVATGPGYTSYLQIYQESCSQQKSIKTVTSTARQISYGLFSMAPDSDQQVSPGKVQDLINWATSAIGRGSSDGDLCQSVRGQIESKYGGYWTVASGEIMAIAHSYNSPNYIRLLRNATHSVLAFMHPRC